MGVMKYESYMYTEENNIKKTIVQNLNQKKRMFKCTPRRKIPS